MGKIILDVEESEMNLFAKQYLSLVELSDEIESRVAEIEKMDKRKKKEVKKAKEDVNFLIDMYNAKSKYKIYNRVK